MKPPKPEISRRAFIGSVAAAGAAAASACASAAAPRTQTSPTPPAATEKTITSQAPDGPVLKPDSSGAAAAGAVRQ